MSEVKIVAIEKVCWKAKMKYVDYISAIGVWNNMQNDFNIKYMSNNPKKRNLVVNSLKLYVIFKYLSESKECTLRIGNKKSIINNNSQ